MRCRAAVGQPGRTDIPTPSGRTWYWRQSAGGAPGSTVRPLVGTLPGRVGHQRGLTPIFPPVGCPLTPGFLYTLQDCSRSGPPSVRLAGTWFTPAVLCLPVPWGLSCVSWVFPSLCSRARGVPSVCALPPWRPPPGAPAASNPPPCLLGPEPRSPQRPTSAGELMAATLYPYWKDDPKAAISVARASTRVSRCAGRGHGLVGRQRAPFTALAHGRRRGT